MSMNFNITKNENVNLLPLGEAFSTESFGVNNLCFLRNNKPLLPVMAEFHFSRYDENEWELELNKIKACGVNIVSTYLFWIHHEEIKEYKNGETIITDFAPGFNCRFLIDGKLRIIVLNESESLNFTSVNIDNENYLLLSDNNSIIFSESGLIKIFTENEAKVKSFPEILNLPSKIENLKPDINTISLIKSENKITEENLYTYYLYDAPSNCPEYILKLDNSLLNCEDFVIYFETNANVTEVFADNELIADDFLKDNSFKLSLKRLKPYLKENKEIRIKCSEIKTTDDIYFESERTKGKLYFKVKSLNAIKTHCFEVKKQ